MHGLYTYLEDNPGPRTPPEKFHELSEAGSYFRYLLDD